LLKRPEGSRPIVRPRLRWEDGIKIDVKEMGCEDMDWIEMAQVRGQW
jgi:hypothetical protein